MHRLADNVLNWISHMVICGQGLALSEQSFFSLNMPYDFLKFVFLQTMASGLCHPISVLPYHQNILV